MKTCGQEKGMYLQSYECKGESDTTLGLRLTLLLICPVKAMNSYSSPTGGYSQKDVEIQ